MILHVFNPEHDIAFAQNKVNFTAPQAARNMRKDVGFIPALWAKDGDCVLVEDVVYAKKAFDIFACRLTDAGLGYPAGDIVFASHASLSSLPIDGVDVWGWDTAVKNELERYGVNGEILPDFNELEVVRQLSHRATATGILDLFHLPDTVGQAFVCATEREVYDCILRLSNVVLKAPWSCSGRGLRFVSPSEITPHIKGWIKNIIGTQGCVVVEPYYDKVCDFGMEFFCSKCGEITYEGLSLFSTVHGAYTGNTIATENFKKSAVTRYVSEMLLDDIKEKLRCECGKAFRGRYRGFFGVDMMVVRDTDAGKYKVHPCVEINLRRTMGHVALALSRHACETTRAVLNIEKNNNYQLKLNLI